MKFLGYGDGLFTSDKGTDNIGIFFGLDYIIFKSQTPCDTGDCSSPNGLAVGDFNNDGNLGLVATLYYSDMLGVFLSYGNGSFTPSSSCLLYTSRCV